MKKTLYFLNFEIKISILIKSSQVFFIVELTNNSLISFFLKKCFVFLLKVYLHNDLEIKCDFVSNLICEI